MPTVVRIETSAHAKKSHLTAPPSQVLLRLLKRGSPSSVVGSDINGTVTSTLYGNSDVLSI